MMNALPRMNGGCVARTRPFLPPKHHRHHHQKITDGRGCQQSVKNVSSASHVFTPHCTRPSFECFRTLDCFKQEGRRRLAPVINTKMERASIYHPSTNWMARPVCSDGWFRWYSFPFQKCLHEDCSVRVCK